MKTLKIITLPITIPLAFLILGVIGAIMFVVLLFNEEKRNDLLSVFDGPWLKK